MRQGQPNQRVVDYWFKHYVNMAHCSLCGNTGEIDTRATAITAAGLTVGRLNYCLCPNGQVLRGLKKIEDRKTGRKR